MKKNDYILICSDENEPTTDLVCEWLNYYKKIFIRISHNNEIEILNIKIFNDETDIKFKVNDKVFYLSQMV